MLHLHLHNQKFLYKEFFSAKTRVTVFMFSFLCHINQLANFLQDTQDIKKERVHIVVRYGAPSKKKFYELFSEFKKPETELN